MITLSCDGIEPAAKKKDKERLIAGKEEENFSSNVSFALYFSVPLLINFPFPALFFGMSSMLA